MIIYVSWFAETIPPHFLVKVNPINIPTKFFARINYIKLSKRRRISWFSLVIPVECLFYPNYFMFLSSAVTHRLVAIARVCSGMNMLELALDGLNWNMLLPQWEIMHQKNFGRVKSPLGRE